MTQRPSAAALAAVRCSRVIAALAETEAEPVELKMLMCVSETPLIAALTSFKDSSENTTMSTSNSSNRALGPRTCQLPGCARSRTGIAILGRVDLLVDVRNVVGMVELHAAPVRSLGQSRKAPRPGWPERGLGLGLGGRASELCCHRSADVGIMLMLSR